MAKNAIPFPSKVEDGVTLYNVARPGGFPTWCDEELARQVMAERSKAELATGAQEQVTDGGAE